MKSTADVVIVGGGVIGTSLLFNLGRLGVTDTLLLEKDVLGSGSTGRSQAICRMHYSNPVTAIMAWESLGIFSNFKEVVGGESGFVETGTERFYAIRTWHRHHASNGTRPGRYCPNGSGL